MLRPILATDDPHEAVQEFLTRGWSLVFETPPGSEEPMACVRLGNAEVMLGTSEERFLPALSAPHKGAGVQLHVQVDPDEMEAVYECHASAGPITAELAPREWGEQSFSTVICGYHFMIAAPL